MFFESIKETQNSYLIRGFPREHFARKLKKHYKTTRLNKLFKAVGMKMFSNGTIEVHKFFVPELIYLLRKFTYPASLIDDIINNTWVKYTSGDGIKDRIDMKRIKATMNVKLLAWQQEFIEEYDINKQKYQLNGYILGFDTGLGKTLTGLALMQALNKKKIIIIAPNSTLETVWESHVEKFLIQKKKVVIVNRDDLDPNADVFIFNYESMGKINEIVDTLANNSEEVGVIVDESHNFLRAESTRTQLLISLRANLGCKDMLLMSGTPVKAVGLEIMPMLMVLDPFFDDEAVRLYKTAFGVNTNIATDVLRTRLSVMMHRKTKKELLKLPPKVERVMKVKIPTGGNYTLDSVKNAVSVFVDQRFTFHEARMAQYLEDFYEAMDWLRTSKKLVSDPDFTRYLSLVTMMRKTRVDLRDPETAANIKWANQYEKDVILPTLPKDLKKKFTSSKSAIKYLHLKIRGEVIGQLLMSLRTQMTSEMVRHSHLDQIIKDSFKKTVIFTSYVETLESAGDYLKELGHKPLLVYGKTSKDVKNILNTFTEQPDANPLVASLKSLSTGVTLTVANTVVFLNKPWRHIEYIQASDRVYRIGQDSDVFIVSILLDTGDKDNLSTRMEDIMEWSKQMFSELVGE